MPFLFHSFLYHFALFNYFAVDCRCSCILLNSTSLFSCKQQLSTKTWTHIESEQTCASDVRFLLLYSICYISALHHLWWHRKRRTLQWNMDDNQIYTYTTWHNRAQPHCLYCSKL